MELLSLRQAAKKLRISEAVLRRAARAGEIEVFLISKRTKRVERESLYKWVRSHLVPTRRSRDGEAKG